MYKGPSSLASEFINRHMKKAYVVLTTILITSIAKPALAATTVDVSNNGSGSTSNVEIHNSVNTSSSSTSNSSNHTSVRIETNGKVKTYESDSGGSVHMESDDGSSKVDINNGSLKGTNTTVAPSPTVSATTSAMQEQKDKINKASEEAKRKIEEMKLKNQDLFTRLEDFFKNLFSRLHL